MRFAFRHLALSFALAMCASAATLERLSLEEMVDQSTAIVRGKVVAQASRTVGSVIYTQYTVQSSQTWKGGRTSTWSVVVPGGSAGARRQHFSGAPVLESGRDYVLFLWTSPRTGLTHLVGLTQGLFEITGTTEAETFASRSATRENMLDRRTGLPVADEPVRMRLRDLDTRITTQLSRGTSR